MMSFYALLDFLAILEGHKLSLFINIFLPLSFERERLAES